MLRERERKSGWWIECFDHSSWSKVGESMFAEVYVNECFDHSSWSKVGEEYVC